MAHCHAVLSMDTHSDYETSAMTGCEGKTGQSSAERSAVGGTSVVVVVDSGVVVVDYDVVWSGHWEVVVPVQQSLVLVAWGACECGRGVYDGGDGGEVVAACGLVVQKEGVEHGESLEAEDQPQEEGVGVGSVAGDDGRRHTPCGMQGCEFYEVAKRKIFHNKFNTRIIELYAAGTRFLTICCGTPPRLRRELEPCTD